MGGLRLVSEHVRASQMNYAGQVKIRLLRQDSTLYLRFGQSV